MAREVWSASGQGSFEAQRIETRLQWVVVVVVVVVVALVVVILVVVVLVVVISDPSAVRS